MRVQNYIFFLKRIKNITERERKEIKRKRRGTTRISSGVNAVSVLVSSHFVSFRRGAIEEPPSRASITAAAGPEEGGSGDGGNKKVVNLGVARPVRFVSAEGPARILARKNRGEIKRKRKTKPNAKTKTTLRTMTMTMWTKTKMDDDAR